MRAPARVEKFFRDEHFVPGFFQVVPVCEATGTRHFRWPRIEDGVMRLSAAHCRRCWKGSTGGGSMKRAKRHPRLSLDDSCQRCGEVNQVDRDRRKMSPDMVCCIGVER